MTDMDMTRAALVDKLGKALKLGTVGRRITQIEVIGHGPNASVYMTLDNDKVLEYPRIGDLCGVTKMTAWLCASAGVIAPSMKRPEAMAAVALMGALNETKDKPTTDRDLGIQHGVEYLDAAARIVCDMADQQSRAQAFSVLRASRDEEMPKETVLQHTDGTLYVRCAWLGQFVRLRGGTGSDVELVRRMQQAGWTRRGGRGQIKATPKNGEPMAMTFWIVPIDWNK